MNDFDLVSQAFGLLLRERVGPLNALAHRLHCSPFVLHKAFRRCAGLTPQQLSAVLTVTRAGWCLVKQTPVLETAIQLGVSGPGRLHDQFVRVEAISPGEWKTGGAGLVFHHGTAETPLGPAEVAWTNRGIHRLDFDSGLAAGIKQRWPAATLHGDQAGAARLVKRIFAGKRNRPFTVAAVGTPFQIAVWRALLTIPSGVTTTYSRLATMIERPGAARAVGQVVGANPVAVLIPCHRVIRENGLLGGYHWGQARKCCLLAREMVGATGLPSTGRRLATIEPATFPTSVGTR